MAVVKSTIDANLISLENKHVPKHKHYLKGRYVFKERLGASLSYCEKTLDSFGKLVRGALSPPRA
ncbi:unnamed protein product [Clavelina lepadiformis]|uniref:Uncharacterized protein n=1 Tax=Clavelina lepadiformis TaxID=159417 RepID=A0ABP0FTV3_CLALP